MTVATVEDQGALEEVCTRIAAAPRVGLDTEFHNERSYTAHLMVIQLAFEDGVAIIDCLAVKDLRPLAVALAEAKVVGHALQGDLRILADEFELLPAQAFDTQVAAAFCGFGFSVSLVDLVRELTGVSLRKSQTVSDWSHRPLSPKQIDYLVDDVRHLFALEDGLRQRLEKRERLEWAIEECRALVDLDRYRLDPRRLYLRVPGNARMSRRELGILNELAILRDRVARERNIPLKFVLPDDVMAGLVHVRPKTQDELGQLRRIDAGMRRQLGAQIIETIKRGEAIPEDALPPKAPRPLSAQREAFVALLAVLVNAIAAQNDVPPATLLSRATLERVARDLPQSIEELRAVLDLVPWRERLVLEPLWETMNGHRALRVAGYEEGVPRPAFGE
ncbi:MAG TPA: ribonuclease D [Candidatus Binatia bacterium]|nr:ribonuclease D [Candidatus Binatia bacterium]